MFDGKTAVEVCSLMVTSDDRDEHSAAAEDLIRFFHALRAEARRDYEALAKKDQDFGEDVSAERSAR